MTDEQINATIAKELGWTQVEAIHRSGRAPGATYVGREFIPNYCSDLNAMHEAEKILIKGFEDEPESSELWSDYQTNLIIACPAYLSYHSTARQRAEAFLLTLGKWSATDKESLTVGATAEDSSVDQKEVQG